MVTRIGGYLDIISVNWTTGYYIIVVSSGDPIPNVEGIGGLFGSYSMAGFEEKNGTEIEGIPELEVPVFNEQPPNVSELKRRTTREIIKIKKLPKAPKKGQQEKIAWTWDMYGQWSTEDIVGLPLREVRATKYTVFLFRASNVEIDPGDETYRLKKKEKSKVALKPDHSVSFEAFRGERQTPGGPPGFGFVDFRIDRNAKPTPKLVYTRRER